MEASVVSVSEGAVGSLLGKLGDLLAGNYNLLKEAIDDIVSLKAELESMRAFLERMSEADEEPDKQDKCWAKEVRDLSYDIEDSVDDFMRSMECESNSKPSGFLKGFIHRTMNLLTTMNSQHKIAKEFRGLKRRVVEASERRTRYKIDDAVFKPNNTPIDIRLLALYEDKSGLVGIGGLRDELIKLMVGEEDVSTQQMKVLSIMGFGGLGKTTLANQIYRKLMCKFECGAFVSVSQKPNIRNIFRRMLSEVGYEAPEGTNMDILAEDELISALRKFLMDKRYSCLEMTVTQVYIPNNKGAKVSAKIFVQQIIGPFCPPTKSHITHNAIIPVRVSFILPFRSTSGNCSPQSPRVHTELQFHPISSRAATGLFLYFWPAAQPVRVLPRSVPYRFPKNPNMPELTGRRNRPSPWWRGKTRNEEFMATVEGDKREEVVQSTARSSHCRHGGRL